MVLGVFLLHIDEDGKVLKRLEYSPSEGTNVVLDDNTILRIRMGHSDKQFVLTLFPSYHIFSMKSEFKVKRYMHTLIIGIYLDKDESSSHYKDSLKRLMDLLLPSVKAGKYEECENVIHSQYKGLFDRPQIILDRKELEKRLSERVKELNKKGKFDEANQLLEKIKRVPKRLYKVHEAAEAALRRGDYEKAQREFEAALEYAKELEENDLVHLYKEKLHLTRKVPTLLSKRKEYVESALNGLRSDRFDVAQKYFKLAADVSEELMDPIKAEEYSLKAKALAEYVKVDKKFRKKK